MESGERHLGLELLRGIAAFGIVGCHLALLPMTKAAWMLRALCDMNVCLFAAISGWLFADGLLKQGQTSLRKGFWPYVKRRAQRLLPTYFTWSAIYIAFGIVFDMMTRHQLNPKLFRDGFWLGVLLKGNASTHLWFIICLFYAQVIFKAIISTTVGRKTSGLIWMATGLLTIVCVAESGTWYGDYFIRLFGSMISGYGLRNLMANQHVGQVCNGLPAAVAAAGIVFHYAFAGMLPTFVRDWMLAMTLLFASLHMSIPESCKRIAMVLGRTSMGVFLIHPLVAAAFGLVFRRFFHSPFGCAPIAADWICVWLASFAMTTLITRIPWLSRLTR